MFASTYIRRAAGKSAADVNGDTSWNIAVLRMQMDDRDREIEIGRQGESERAVKYVIASSDFSVFKRTDK